MKNYKNLPVLLITFIRKKNIKKLIKILDKSTLVKYIFIQIMLIKIIV